MVKHCKACKIDLQDEYSYNGHIQGKKHMINVQRMEQTQSLIQRSIFVSLVPHLANAEILNKFFSQFGEIKKFRLGSDHALIEFCNEEPVNYLLQHPVVVQGTRLKISRRIVNEKGPPPKKKNDSINNAINDSEDLKFQNIQSIFSERNQSFEDQACLLIDKITLDDEALKSIYELTCKQLNDIFKTIFPNCHTYRFGSTISGLGFKNCDLDLYLDIGCPMIQDSKNGHANSKSARGAISATTVFAEVKRILYSKAKVFSEICPIPRAKTPIIKFRYLPTNISCDISFKNSLAVHNSRLIKFCLSIDPRFYRTMVIIKYWMCNFELGMGNKMSKYALTMLFLFYLQQESVNLLPPLKEIKKTPKLSLVEGWEVSFDNKTEFYKKERDESKITVPELLHGFYEFYARFDFEKKVICPLDGRCYEKSKFNEIENLPDCMQRYKDYLKNTENPYLFPVAKPICIQDPNELNHNPGGNVHQKLLESLQKNCAMASEICAKSKEKNYQDLLPSLFSMTIEQPERAKRNDAKVNIFIRAHSFLEVGLPENYQLPPGETDRAGYAREHWYQLILSIIRRFFEGVLKLDVQYATPEPEQKQQKLDPETDVHSKDKIVLHCTGNYCLWRKRHGKMNILDPSLNMLTKEVLISDHLFQEYKSKEVDPKFHIDFYCYFTKKVVPDIQVNLTLRNSKTSRKLFPELSAYIKAKLIVITNKTLIHMQQYKKLSIE